MGVTHFAGPVGVALAVCLLVILASGLIAFARRTKTLPQTLFALGLQASAAVLFYLTLGLQGDSANYELAGRALADSWSSGMPPAYSVFEGKQSVSYAIATFYALVGPIPLFPLIALSIAVSALPLLMALTTSNFGFPGEARYAAWLAACAPQVVLWSPWLRREGIAFLSLGLCLLAMSLVYAGHQFRGVAVAFAATFAVLLVRPPLIAVLATGMAMVVLVIRANTPESGSLSQIHARGSTNILLVVVLTVITIGSLATTYAGESLDPDVRTAIVTDNSSIDKGLRATWTAPVDQGTSIGSHPIGLAWGMTVIDSLFGPPMWTQRSFGGWAASMDGILNSLIIGLLFVGFWKFPDTRRLALISVAAAAPLVLGEVWTHANYGIAMRVRAHYFVLLLPMVAVASHRLMAKARSRLGNGR